MTIYMPKLSETQRWESQPMLGVKRKAFRLDDQHAHLADKAFEAKRSQIFLRDQWKCRYCTFGATSYQEVHHLDDDHHNNSEENLLTICTLCHQVHHVGMMGIRNSGFLAPVPELTQVEINHICRAYFVNNIIGSAAEKDRLNSVYAIFEDRADQMKKVYGVDISSPVIWGKILADDLDDAQFARRDELLKVLRVIPNANSFHKGQLEFYATAGNKGSDNKKQCMPVFSPRHWQALFDSFAREFGLMNPGGALP